MTLKIISTKEIVERRQGEPIIFLFLPKMGLLGSQASTEKKLVVNYDQLLKAVFSWFHEQEFNFLKLLKIKVLRKLKNFGKFFFGLKTVVI